MGGGMEGGCLGGRVITCIPSSEHPLLPPVPPLQLPPHAHASHHSPVRSVRSGWVGLVWMPACKARLIDLQAMLYPKRLLLSPKLPPVLCACYSDLKSPNLLVDSSWRVKVGPRTDACTANESGLSKKWLREAPTHPPTLPPNPLQVCDFNLSKYLSDSTNTSSVAAMNPRHACLFGWGWDGGAGVLCGASYQTPPQPELTYLLALIWRAGGWRPRSCRCAQGQQGLCTTKPAEHASWRQCGSQAPARPPASHCCSPASLPCWCRGSAPRRPLTSLRLALCSGSC